MCKTPIRHILVYTMVLSFNLMVCVGWAGLPKGCEIEDIKTELLQLNGQDNTLIYIQNLHPQDIYLANQNLQLTTKLIPLQWSVLMPKSKNATTFTCVESKPGAEQRIPCAGLIKICRLSHVEFAGDIENTQWLVSNETLENSYDILTVKHIKVA